MLGSLDALSKLLEILVAQVRFSTRTDISAEASGFLCFFRENTQTNQKSPQTCSSLNLHCLKLSHQYAIYYLFVH